MTALAYVDVLSVDTLGLSSMTTSALLNSHIETIGELREKTPEELGGIPGIGRKGVLAIAEALKSLSPA